MRPAGQDRAAKLTEVRIYAFSSDIRAIMPRSENYGLMQVGIVHNGQVLENGSYNLSRYHQFDHTFYAPNPSTVSIAMTNTSDTQTWCRSTRER